MSKLTLPIVVGKKYVRRDGMTAVVGQIKGGLFILSPEENGYTSTGRCSSFGRDCPADLVADYIEPAKGHPHAAAMAEFAKDAAESVTPWDRWEKLGPYEGNQWEPMGCDESFFPFNQYRRKPTITPDPHAATAAEYAKDMAETDKAWERWEYSPKNHSDVWSACFDHPAWRHATMYRRRSQS